jgi:uncharacterized protein YgiB involved in biofilm formation
MRTSCKLTINLLAEEAAYLVDGGGDTDIAGKYQTFSECIAKG